MLFWIYRSLFSLLSVGLFSFSFYKTYKSIKKYKPDYDKFSDESKSYIKERIKRGIVNGLKHNKLLLVVNFILFIILIIVNIIVWTIRFE
jgi:hypothetical protein